MLSVDYSVSMCALPHLSGRWSRAAGVDSPECSSFTSDDMVFVIESAATNRSFRRFLGTPGKKKDFQIKITTHVVSCSVIMQRCKQIQKRNILHITITILEIVHTHPERRPRARPLPPLPGSPAVCELGWSRPRWSVWAWAWSSPLRDWGRNEGSLRTGTAT